MKKESRDFVDDLIDYVKDPDIFGLKKRRQKNARFLWLYAYMSIDKPIDLQSSRLM